MKKLYEQYDLVWQAINELEIKKMIKFKYRLVAYLLAMMVVISPIIIFITMFIYHDLVYFLGILIVLMIMIFLYLADYFYLKMLKNDMNVLIDLPLKPILKFNLLLYGGLGIIVYLIYFGIVRLILRL